MAEGGRGPGPLGLPTFADVPEATEGAWWADLSRWVDGIRADYWHLWPDPPSGIDVYSRVRRRAFPRCWRKHQGVVSDLVVLKTWHGGLCEGTDWAGGVQGWHEWRVFLDRFADYLQVVAQLCTPMHQGAMREPVPVE